MILSIAAGLVVLLLNNWLSELLDIVNLVLGFGIGAALYWFFAKLFNFDALNEFQYIIQTKLLKRFAK